MRISIISAKRYIAMIIQAVSGCIHTLNLRKEVCHESIPKAEVESGLLTWKYSLQKPYVLYYFLELLKVQNKTHLWNIVLGKTSKMKVKSALEYFRPIQDNFKESWVWEQETNTHVKNKQHIPSFSFTYKPWQENQNQDYRIMKLPRKSVPFCKDLVVTLHPWNHILAQQLRSSLFYTGICIPSPTQYLFSVIV